MISKLIALIMLLLCIQQTAFTAPAEVIADEALAININGQALLLPYYANLDPTATHAQVTIAVISIHGISKNADDYFERMLRAADIANIYPNAIIVAPQFLDETDISHHGLGNNYLHWQASSPNGRSQGNNSLNSPNSLSSFAALDHLVSLLTNNNPNLCQVIMVGHSAGGQMVQRYAQTTQVENSISIPIRYVVANPSSYAYLDHERRVAGTTDQFAIPTTSCNSYNEWKYGLEDLGNTPYVASVGATTIRNQYKNREVIYLLGSLDNDPNDPNLDRNCAAMLQGNHRLERGEIYYNYLQRYYTSNYGFDITQTHSRVIVPNVGHSSSEMFTSPTGVSAIFNVDAVGTHVQEGWTIQAPAYTPEDLEYIFFFDGLYGWFCGDGGTIFRTTDGGLTWTPASTLTGTSTARIRGIHFISRLEGWACRSSGRVLHTVDGGDTWVTIDTGAGSTLRSIYFIDSQIGWAAGSNGVIVKTVDGGASWSIQDTDTNTSNRIRKLFFIDASHGWAVGENATAFKTSNGGDDWVSVSIPTGETIRDVIFTSATNGWMAGHAGVLLNTQDGGSTWSAKKSPTLVNLRDIAFSGNLGWAVGSNGVVIRTYDGGENWFRQESNVNSNLWSIAALNSDIVMAVGIGGTLIRTTTGGRKCTLNINLGTDRTIIAGESEILLADANCYSNTDFSWNTGDNTRSLTIQSSDYSLGTHTFTVSGTNAIGCTSNSSVDITIIENPLPVQLLHFSGKIIENAGLLKWVIAQETEVSHIEIESSTTGYDFYKVGTVNTLGNNSRYEFTDENIHQGLNYYRLKMVDKDGAIGYSEVIRLSLGTPSPLTLMAYPNPVKQGRKSLTLTLTGIKSLNPHLRSISLANALGKVVWQNTRWLVNPQSTVQIELNISDLPSGLYLLHVDIDSWKQEYRTVQSIQKKIVISP